MPMAHAPKVHATDVLTVMYHWTVLDRRVHKHEAGRKWTSEFRNLVVTARFYPGGGPLCNGQEAGAIESFSTSSRS